MFFLFGGEPAKQQRDSTVLEKHAARNTCKFPRVALRGRGSVRSSRKNSRPPWSLGLGNGTSVDRLPPLELTRLSTHAYAHASSENATHPRAQKSSDETHSTRQQPVPHHGCAPMDNCLWPTLRSNRDDFRTYRNEENVFTTDDATRGRRRFEIRIDLDIPRPVPISIPTTYMPRSLYQPTVSLLVGRFRKF